MSNKHTLFSVITALLFLTIASVSVQAQTTPATVSADDLAAFESLIQSEMAYFNIPGAAAAVIVGDEVVYAQGFGLRDVAADAPFTTETQFRIGSTTKSMTSLLIAQLVDEGLLTWDTLVTDLFPNFQTTNPERTAQITVRDLMGMATGLVSSPLDGMYWGDWDVDALLNAVAHQQIGGDFRDFYSYNNEVYALAGYAAAIASDLDPSAENYRSLLQTRIFDPIGMDSAVITDDVRDLSANYAESYETSLMTGDLQLMTDPPINVVAPAGAVWVNIEDMARYVITQMHGGVTPDGERIVSAEALAETRTAGIPMDFDLPGIANTAYGMGWVTQTYYDIPIQFHDGGWAGYSTQMMIFPADDTAVILFANSSNGATFNLGLTYAFAELVHDLDPAVLALTHQLNDQTNAQIEQARTMISLDLGDVAAFVGDYEQGWTVEQRDDGSLWIIRGAWQFQVGYVEALDGYMLVSGGAVGTIINFETDGDAMSLNLQLGENETLSLARVE